MASATEIAYVTAAAMLDNSINALLNSGTGNAIINIYDNTGTIPVNCEATNNTNVLLATCVMNNTPFAAATDQAPGARISANTVSPEVSALATGTATYFRAYSTNGSTDASKLVCYIQGSAGEAADSTDLTLDVKLINIGGTVTVTAWNLDVPES
jgi:hypothetical protein